MKKLARFLFMKYYREELLSIANYCRTEKEPKNAGRVIGTINALEVLDLLT